MLLCIIPIEADRFLFLKASYFMDPGYYASWLSSLSPKIAPHRIIKALRYISKRWFLVNFTMGAWTYAYHCISHTHTQTHSHAHICDVWF
jgi:hypothetical protein